jgi:hypothetical protein
MPAEVEATVDRGSAPVVEPAGRKPSPGPDPGARRSERAGKGRVGAGKAAVPPLEGIPPHGAECAVASRWGDSDATADAPQDEATPVLHANPLSDDEDASASPRSSNLAAASAGADGDAEPGEGDHASEGGDTPEGDPDDPAPAGATVLPLPALPYRGEPPKIKALPSANSAFAIEVLQGLASGSPRDRADRARAFQAAANDAVFATEQAAAGAAAARDAIAAAEEAATCRAAEDMLEGASSAGLPRLAPGRSVITMCSGVTPAAAMNYYAAAASHSPPPRVLSPPHGFYQSMGGPPAMGYAMAHPPAQRSPLPTTRMPPPPQGYAYAQHVPSPQLFSSMMTSAEGQQRRWSRAPAQQALQTQSFSLPAAAVAAPAPLSVEVGDNTSDFLAEETSTSRPGSAGKRPRAKKGADVDDGKAAAVTPWRPSEDSTILQGVAGAGCKWSLIAQKLPGRSDNAVRNRWHRLEKAERQRREALQAGRPVEGYRCRKCGHFKKGHMCLGLENVGTDGTVLPNQGGNLSPAKRGRAMMSDPIMASRMQMGVPPQGYAPGPSHMQHEYYAPQYYDHYGPLPMQGGHPQHLVYVQPHNPHGGMTHQPQYAYAAEHSGGYEYAPEHGYASNEPGGGPHMQAYLASEHGGQEHYGPQQQGQ